jgi:hypothetical protein
MLWAEHNDDWVTAGLKPMMLQKTMEVDVLFLSVLGTLAVGSLDGW